MQGLKRANVDDKKEIARAMSNPKERNMLLKLDGQLQKFIVDAGLQHLRFNGVGGRNQELIRLVADRFRIKVCSLVLKAPAAQARLRCKGFEARQCIWGFWG